MMTTRDAAEAALFCKDGIELLGRVDEHETWAQEGQVML